MELYKIQLILIIIIIYIKGGIDKKTPDMFDFIGGVVCLVGVGIILWAPRH